MTDLRQSLAMQQAARAADPVWWGDTLASYDQDLGNLRARARSTLGAPPGSAAGALAATPMQTPASRTIDSYCTPQPPVAFGATTTTRPPLSPSPPPERRQDDTQMDEGEEKSMGEEARLAEAAEAAAPAAKAPKAKKRRAPSKKDGDAAPTKKKPRKQTNLNQPTPVPQSPGKASTSEESMRAEATTAPWQPRGNSNEWRQDEVLDHPPQPQPKPLVYAQRGLGLDGRPLPPPTPLDLPRQSPAAVTDKQARDGEYLVRQQLKTFRLIAEKKAAHAREPQVPPSLFQTPNWLASEAQAQEAVISSQRNGRAAERLTIAGLKASMKGHRSVLERLKEREDVLVCLVTSVEVATPDWTVTVVDQTGEMPITFEKITRVLPAHAVAFYGMRPRVGTIYTLRPLFATSFARGAYFKVLRDNLLDCKHPEGALQKPSKFFDDV